MNSNDPTTTGEDSDRPYVLSNPARPILYIISAFGLLQGAIGVLAGLFVGPHILGAAIGMIAFASTALWLGHRRYDRFARYGTILWGGLAVLIILAATALQPPTTQDVAGIAFIAIMLVLVGAVLIVAVWKGTGGIAL